VSYIKNKKPGMQNLFKNNSRKIIFLLAMAMIVIGCRFYFNTTTDTFNVNKTTSSIENGRNLTHNICGGCHYDPRVNKFIGRPLNDLPKIAGKLYSANLTHSALHGRPPQYSDAELFYLLKTGISKNGKFMPYMMRPMMADQDVNDIIAFLRSDDPAVMAADTTVGKTHINFIGKAGIRFVSRPQPYNKGVQRPDETDPIAFGRYLVAVIGCYHCHSKKVLALNYLEPDKTKGYLQGGIKLKDPDGKRLRGPNLTPDKETGIGSFTKEDFQKAIREGTTPSGKKLSPPMPKFKHLTDRQVNAIYTYLFSLPPVRHKV
jgi:mono/diheme cytochrome c family protein